MILENHTPFWTQYWYLLQRFIRNTLRNPFMSYLKLLNIVIKSIIVILVFGTLVENWSEASISNRNGILFLTVQILYISSVNNTATHAFEDQKLFEHENSNRLYSPTAYFLAKLTSELPNAILIPAVYSCIVYFSVMLNTDSSDHFFIFLFYSMMLYFSVTALSMIFMGKDKLMMVEWMSFLLIPFAMFSGFYVNQENIPSVLDPIEFLSIYKYAYQVYTTNEFEDLDLGWRFRDPFKEKNFKENMITSVILNIFLLSGLLIIAYLRLLYRAKKTA